VTANKNYYMMTHESIKQDFYMDDLDDLTGTSTKEEAIKLKIEVVFILPRAGFELHKWSSNEPSIINNISNILADNNNEVDSVRICTRFVLGTQR